ncbi:hypothetical protein PF004_g11972 [Phytophthora fragariae]|uniref:Uncharacterized protein n=1 Tax=Phytophthora fragariae TaxID=53985 RepID=A0A6G0NWG6_9STRA|nr:hypothetical protein PF004_g11972 [Phytophthora fragariae]
MSRLYSGKAKMTHDSWSTRMLNNEDAEGPRWWAVELLQPKLKFGPRELISMGIAYGVELVCYDSEAIPDLEEKLALRLELNCHLRTVSQSSPCQDAVENPMDMHCTPTV